MPAQRSTWRAARLRLAAWAARRPRRLHRRLWPTAGAAASVFAVCLLSSLAAPDSARAGDIPNPLYVIGNAAGDAVTAAFGALLNALFGDIAAGVTAAFITWLVAIPNFTGNNLDELSAALQAVALGLLALVLTMSVLRFWLAGLSPSGAGGIEAAEGITRTIGALLFIAIWPWLFRQGVALRNSATDAVMSAGSVRDDLARLLGGAFVFSFSAGAVGVGWIVPIIIALAGALLFLALVTMKVVISVATAVLFVGMPLAVMVWPIPETSWIARLAARGMLVCLAVPLVWVVVFATAAALNVDTLSFQGGGNILDKLFIKPLTGIALLVIVVTAPRGLMRAAMMGLTGPGGSIAGRTVAYATARDGGDFLRSKLPWNAEPATQPMPGGSTGGAAHASWSTRFPETQTASSRGPREESSGSGEAAGPEPSTKTGGAGSGASSTAGSASSAAAAGGGAVAPAAGAAAGAKRGAAMRSGADQNATAAAGPGAGENREQPQTTAAAGDQQIAPAGSEQSAAAAVAAVGERSDQTPAGRRPRNQPFNPQAFERELRAARARQASDPPSAGDIASAYAQLPQDEQALVREAVTGDGDTATRAFADEAVHAGGLSDQQRDALRTLAAARHGDRAQGIGLACATSPLGDGGRSDGGGAAGPADAAVDAPVGSTGGAVTDEPLDRGGGGAATAARPPAPPVITDQPLEHDAPRSPGPPGLRRPLEQGPPPPSPPPFTGRPDEE